MRELVPKHAAYTPIKLNVGGWHFTMARDTLQESLFLTSLTSDGWDSNKKSDDSFFIDADPDIFKHVTKYLRRGAFPIFYDEAKGHDDLLYYAVLAEARYLIVPKLVDWLEKKKYLLMVFHKIDISEVKINEPKRFIGFDNVEYRHVWGYDKAAVCPLK